MTPFDVETQPKSALIETRHVMGLKIVMMDLMKILVVLPERRKRSPLLHLLRLSQSRQLHNRHRVKSLLEAN